MNGYFLNREDIRVPPGEKELLFFLRWIRPVEDALRGDFKGALPFTESAKRLCFFSLFLQLAEITESVRRELKKEFMIGENSILALDIRLATSGEQGRAAEKLFEDMERTDGEVLFQKAPLLKKWVEQKAERHIQTTRELLERLTKDREAICGAFFEGRDFGAVTEIKTDGADMHFHGRSTCVLHTQEGAFVYKPHDCGTDLRFYDLVQRWFPDFLKAAKCLNFGDYGYCEFIGEEGVSSEEAIDRYFQRLGGACALFQALGSSDLHSGNWIAHGDYPALIDLETILSAVPEVFSNQRICPEILGEGNGFLYDANRSLLPSGILPDLQKNKQFSVLLDDSQWAHGLPILQGVRHRVMGHEESFHAGFEQGYDRCIRLRGELLETVKGFKDLPIRALLRQTEYYARIRRKLLTPSALQSAESQQKVIEELERYFIRHGAERMKPIAAWEGQCLLEGDIPYFHVKGDGCHLYGYDSLLIPGFFRTSAVGNAAERLSRLGEKEKRFEQGILRQSIDTAVIKMDQNEAVPGSDDRLPNAPVITKGEARAEAEEIFQKISAMALCGPSGKISWMVHGDNHDRLRPASPAMAQGTAGMGIFFSALSAVSENREQKKKAEELASICLEQIANSVRLLDRAQVIPESSLALGITNGFGGVLQSLTLMEGYLGSAVPGQLALELLPLLDKAPIEQAEHMDVFSGAAGLLLALCENDRICSSDAGLRQIRRTADCLLAGRRQLKDGGPLLWDTLKLGRGISGAGHGMAGIAAALMAAADVLKTEKYARGALDALVYERDIYSERLKTWPDLRGPLSDSRAMHGLCSGAPGIGMAFLYCRKRAYQISDSEGLMLDEEISRAVEVCLNHPPLFRDHLCCGNSSAVEFLLQASQDPGGRGETCRKAAGRLLGWMKGRKSLKRGYSFLPPGYRPVFAVGLFYGGAGIGYEMLRYAAPERISPILF